MEITPCHTHIFEWYKKLKGHKVEKDEFRSGRPLTSRTEINDKWVRQVVCCVVIVSWLFIESQLDMKKNNVWKINTKDLDMSKK